MLRIDLTSTLAIQPSNVHAEAKEAVDAWRRKRAIEQLQAKGLLRGDLEQCALRYAAQAA